MSENYLESLARELDKWYEGDREQVGPVMEALIDAIREDIDVIVPVSMPDDGVWNSVTEDTNEGSTISHGQDLDLEISHIQTSEGKYYFAFFTGMDEVEKGIETPTINTSIKSIMVLAATDEGAEGIVINPWGNNITLPKDIIMDIVDSARPLRQDEIDLEDGSRAYNKGDYATAFELYTKSAESGNPTALSNLGYCYYYGRSVETDKEKAHTCWEKAALMGDICATYKLGDMYRNGDLPEDLPFSRAMYHKAFEEALEFRDLYSYPDACLRMIKFCRDDLTPEVCRKAAEDAADGFKERMDEGDPFAKALYEEACSLLDEIKRGNKEDNESL